MHNKTARYSEICTCEWKKICEGYIPYFFNDDNFNDDKLYLYLGSLHFEELLGGAIKSIFVVNCSVEKLQKKMFALTPSSTANKTEKVL